ncbi:MAG: hypothetical protein HON90_15825 [Halobacteriovoraceae bacterium]|jgi:hypothetical protein|nr:hypothetical protein [Halobacteriovoraceae bacterium]
MKFRFFLVLLSIFLISLSTHARKPAVEDFVGVIPESYKPTPQGTEVLFDFNQKIQQVEMRKMPLFPQDQSINFWSSIWGVVALIALPILLWNTLTNFGRIPGTNYGQRSQENQKLAEVKELDHYRKKNSDDDDYEKNAS